MIMGNWIFLNGYPNWPESYKNRNNKGLIEHRWERKNNRSLEKYGAPIMKEFHEKKGVKKDIKTITNDLYQYKD